MWCTSHDLKHRYCVVEFGRTVSGFDGHYESPKGWFFDIMCKSCGKIKHKKLKHGIPRNAIRTYAESKGWQWGLPYGQPVQASQPLIKEQ